MPNFDNRGSMVSIVAGSQIAAGGTFASPVIDLAPFEGNAIIMVSVNGAGTGTLVFNVQEGTAAVSAWTNCTTLQMFTTDGSFQGTATPSTFAQVIVGLPAVQVRALNLEKTNQFMRINFTGTDSSYRITAVAFLPRKYANADYLG